MKISFTTLACPSWNIQTAIEQARALGYDGVELRFIENTDRLWELPSFHAEGLNDTRERLASAGLVVPCVDTSCLFHFPDPAQRLHSIDMGKRMVELAAALNAPGVRVFGDRVQPGADLPSTAAWVAEGIHRLAEFAQPLGIEIWLESHGNFAPAAATVGVLRAAHCPNSGAIWDPLNSYSEFAEELDQGWRVIAEDVRHVHIKDARPVQGAPQNQPWEPALLGEGNFPAHQLVALLRKQNYRRFVSFEWEKKWHPQIEDPEIALPHFIRWMRSALEA